jgi:YD repeat-containing protein
MLTEISYQRHTILRDIAVTPEGSIYLTEDGWTGGYSRIHKINPDGVLITVAGNDSGRIGDGYFATQTRLIWLEDIIYGPNGEIYFSDGHSIRKIGLDGRIKTLAQTESVPDGLTFNPINGYLYYIDDYGMRICYVTPDGVVNTIAGAGTSTFDYSGDGIAATASFDVIDLCIETDGNILIAGNDRIRRISSAFPGFTASDITISSKNGSELYKFTPNGKHVATHNAFTGALMYSFQYDPNGYLTSITDSDGNITTIERDVNGNPTAIIAPFGQKTLLSVNSDGYLESISNPAMERIKLTYKEGGLLETFTDARNGTHQFTYDELGRLIRDEDPAGGYTELQRTETTNGYQITKTQAVTGSSTVVSTYLSESLPNGDKHWFVKGCCGEGTDTVFGKDGSRKITLANGNIITTVEGPDPRFGMQAPIIKSMTVTTPDGLKYEMTGERTAELEDPNDAFSLLTQTDIVTINGKTHTTVYDATTRTFTSTTPMGRQSVTTLDEQGRVVKVEAPGLAPVVFEYDERGRLVRTTEGTGSEARVSSIDYAGNGLVDYITDPLGRQTRFEYDPVGRVTRQILPGGKQISFSYDPNGNMTKLVPPGKPEHGFGYNAVDLNDTYTPPEVGVGDTQTKYGYNLAKQATIVTRPDGKTIGFSYDTSGRLQELLIPEGEITYAYHADTGNLTNILAPGSTMSYTYDGSLLKKTAWSGVIGGNVSVTYNDDLMVTSQSVNDGDSVSYGYDDDGMLTSAGSLTISRDARNGMMTGSTIGSVSDSITYNGFGELERYQAKFDGSTLYSVDYDSRDKLGRIVTKTETVNGETHTYRYVYDPNTDELTDVYKDGALVSHYDYDDNG